jgi:TM2 domain-containing membrane protein YozV
MQGSGRIAVACVLGWLLPGAGHLYMGKKVKGLVFLAIVLLTFAGGLLLQGRIYLADREQPLSYLATMANVALGPLDLVGRYVCYGRILFVTPSESDHPAYQEILSLKRSRILAVTNEYGTTFLLAAGLMNVLLLLDLFDIGIGRKR